MLTAPPLQYLLTIDQLATPDFTVIEPARLVDPATLAGGDSKAQHQLHDDGFNAAATVRFSRQVELGTSNGPIDIIATVESFNANGGAHHAFARDIQRLDAQAGASAISTATLGDEAHADSVVRKAPSGIPLVQITLEWRTVNVLNVLVVRGRYGGTRLDDALLLAHRIASNEIPAASPS